MTTSVPARQALIDLPPAVGDQRLKVLSLDLGTWSSTAAIHEDARIDHGLFDPAHELAMRAALVAFLERPELRAQEPHLMIDIVGALAGQPAPRLTSLADVRAALLRDGEHWNGLPQPEYTRLRRAVCVALERRLLADQQLSAALAWPLHQLYDSVYATPTLRADRLWRVGLRDRFREPEIRSILAVNLANVLDSHLIDAVVSDVDRPRGTVYESGIKRRLLRVEPVDQLTGAALPRQWAADTDLLIAQSYADLMRRVVAAIADTTDEQALLHGIALPRDCGIDEVTVTYPTTLPPSVRTRLRGLVSDSTGLPSGRVHLDYDEAVAAALFFVLRGFGGDFEAGLRSFRATSRPVTGARLPTWRQNMLVVDIGGGTTDIALLALEMIDDSATRPGFTPEAEGFHGRHYTLRPRVLGTTGHPQLGGDLLTLRIFYWLKAALADALDPAAAAGGGGLAERVVSFGRPDPVPDDVRRLLRERLPSHSGRPGVRSATFDRLWEAAETAKISYLAQGSPYVLEQTWADVLPSDCAWRDAVRRLPEGAVVLSAEDFRRVLEPLVDQAVGLGAELVRRALGDEAGQRLDVVALSGRTTGVPVVRDLVRDRLTTRLLRRDTAGPPPVPWNSHAVVTEQRYAKQAASLGACWARAVHQLGAHAGQEPTDGVDQLTIDVDNLLVTLPGDFGLAGAHDKVRPLLRRGAPMEMAVSHGPLAGDGANLFTTTPWRRLETDELHLHRILGEDLTIQWGTFQYSRHRGAAGPPPGLWYQLAVDQDLTAWISLCRGTRDEVRPVMHPLTGADRDSEDLLDLYAEPRLAGYFSGQVLAELPSIEVAAMAHPDDVPEFVEVFRPGSAAERLTVDFVDEGAPLKPGASYATAAGSSWLRGAVSVRALPAMPGRARHRPDHFLFRAVVPGHQPVPLGEVRPPGLAEEQEPSHTAVPYWAVLDERGRLRVHAGYPDHLAADSLEEMEREPGMVLTRALRDSGSDWKVSWDPTTGDH